MRENCIFFVIVTITAIFTAGYESFNDNLMLVRIVQIGDNKGILLSPELLHKLNLSIGSLVDVSSEGDKIVLKVQPRQGWEDAARQAHELGDDCLLLS